ncbi:MAG: DUF2155 domain-containing protein [Rhizomicrobium sp.]|nr:DUF2155 domain-containing protein [Rhizomicrobium sp.]
MRKIVSIALGTAALMAVAAALAQTVPLIAPAPTATPAPAPDVAPIPEAAVVPPPSTPVGPPAHAVLELRALDKITGRASIIMAPLNKTVKFATLEITARTCYSTPPSETPETSAFLQIDDHRADQSQGRAFSGWMYASSPGLNSLQHPLYDVWVISCMASSPGQAPAVIAAAPVKVLSPNAGANEAMPALPEDAGQ